MALNALADSLLSQSEKCRNEMVKSWFVVDKFQPSVIWTIYAHDIVVLDTSHDRTPTLRNEDKKHWTVYDC